MIRTVADLLEALLAQETALLHRYDLQHGPMIGSMYEGLTRSVLHQAIPDGLNLRVVEGKIRNSKGALSRQIDCMIVSGECEPVPHTTFHLCDVQQVLAVVEVKKSLYSTELADSLALMMDFLSRIYEPHEMKRTLIRDAWASLMLSELPRRDELQDLSAFEQAMFHILSVEANLPLRIIFAYGGFTTEYGLRKALAAHMERKIGETTKGYALGPLAMPNQIVCGNHSIIKVDGMPFSAPVNGDEWPLLATCGGNPLHFLLELLWTRLCYRYGLGAEVFGEDLAVEHVNRFLDARPAMAGDSIMGWTFRYNALSKSALKRTAGQGEWSPEVLTAAQYTIIVELCAKESIDLNDPGLADFLIEKGTTVEDLVSDLRAKRLAYARSGTLRLLTKECASAIVDGRFVAGENSSGRFARWLARQIQALRPQNGS